MTTTPQDNWKDYFTTFSNNNIDANRHIEAFLDASTPSRDRDLKIEQLSKDHGHSIMLYYSSITSSIHFLHSLTNLGGTTWNPEPILVALDGFSTGKAYPVLIDIESIFKDISVFAPTFTRLSVITDKESLITTTAPENNPQKFKHLPFLLLPPLFWNIATKLKDLSPSNVFIEFLKCIESFISDNKDNDEFNSITKNSFNNVLTFLWAAAHAKVSNINILPSGDIPSISTWAKNHHNKCIKSITPPNNNQINNDDILRLSTVLESTHQTNQSILNESSSTSSDKKGFEKLDESIKNLILNAASPNNEIAAATPPTTCSSFFKQSSHGNARLNFIRSLKHQFGASVEVSAGVITSIYNGGFLWTHDDSPSNFSAFSFPEKQIFGKNAMTDCIILQLKEISGKGLSTTDVEAALKQGIQIPTSVDSMRYSLLNLTSASKFFFSDDSLLSNKLTQVYNHIIRHRITYMSMAHQDRFFIAQFLFALDTRINLWLESCESCKFRDEVDDSLIDFTEILHKVRTRNFSHKLPLSIREVLNEETRQNEGKPDNMGPLQKRQRQNQPTPNNDKTVNSGTIDKWMVNEPTYSTKLRSGSSLKTRPLMNDVPICHRWHSKGYCFDNCNNKTTHIASSSLPPQAKKDYSKWVDTATNA